ncbi:MAG TPA: hypothetical protein VG603_01895 [Chitinophagales bacterium]|nr:hypothetical protein [Chitinophagales bacterium]
MQELYNLVKSLNAEEKRYFRRYGIKDDSKGKSHTLALFELLDAEESFDEERIQNRLKRAKLDKNTAQLRSYLFGLLVETLAWYHKENIQGFGTAYDLARINILEDRGLEEEAAELSEETVNKALTNGSFIEKWEALGKSIYKASNEFLADKRNEFEDVNNWIAARGELLEQMGRFHAYDTLLVQQLRIMRKTMQARNEDDAARLKQIFENDLVQHADLANTPPSRFIFHTLRLHYYQIINHWENFFEEARTLLAYIKGENGKGLATMQVLWAYAQATQACYFTRRWKELAGYLDELQGLPTHNLTEKTAQFVYYTQLAITLFDFKGDTEKLNGTLHDARQKLSEFKHRLRPDIRLAITITCASACVEYGDYNGALDLCEDFLTNYDAGVRLDALLMLYVYEFISHLETGNMVYVNNTLQNVNRYFLRNDYKGQFETVLLKVFRKLSEVSDYHAVKGELEKLKAELQTAAGGEAQSPHVPLLPIVQSFIDAKISGLKIHEYAAQLRSKSQ